VNDKTEVYFATVFNIEGAIFSKDFAKKKDGMVN